MRVAILLAAPLAMGFGPAQATETGAPAEPAPTAPEAAPALPFTMPGYSRPAPLATGDLDDFLRRKTCRDTIEHAREENGQPPLDQRDGPADGTPEPMLYKAVDHHVDGCDVLVMAGNPDDIRPVPEGGRVRVIRSRSTPEAAPAR